MTEDREATIDSNDGISTEAIIDSNDGTSSISGEGFVSQLVDQLPDGADSFSNQASQNIVESVASGNPIVELDPIRESITGEFDHIPANQVEGIVAASLFKAADSMNSGGSDRPDNSPDSGTSAGTTPNLPSTDPSSGNDPGWSLCQVKMAFPVIRRQRSRKGVSVPDPFRILMLKSYGMPSHFPRQWTIRPPWQEIPLSQN